jgi:methylated-DNA-[protein]-cysteine S-methyltransferase
MQNTVINSPLPGLGSRIAIATEDGYLKQIHFVGNSVPLKNNTDVCTKQVVLWLNAYFEHEVQEITFPVLLQGTDFQKKVWNSLPEILSGTTNTYGELARELKSGARAIGNACRKNPVPLVYPCHRVVSANGQGGFMGKTSGIEMDIKQWLLLHERN